MEPSSSNTELNRTASAPVIHENETNLQNLKPYSSVKNLSPSSSPDSTSLQPPLHNNNDNNNNNNNEDDDNQSTSSSASSLSQKSDKTPIPEPAAPVEAPPPQEMNRSPSAYRIPSSVFERSKSSTPTDWSVASNESLFSIHMGNMSFTNDQYFMWRSGELGPPAEPSTSDQIFSYAGHESGGSGGADMRSHELGLAEATMLEVIKESEVENQAIYKTSLAEVRKARRSEGSNTSNKSFAFSVMGGETGSSKRGRVPSSVRSNREQATVKPVPESQPDPKTPPTTGNEAQSNWLSCFSCCISRQ